MNIILIIAFLTLWALFIGIGLKIMTATKLNKNPSNQDVFFRALLLSLFFCPGFVAIGYLPLPLPVGLLFILAIFALLSDWLSLVMNANWHAVSEFLLGIALPYILSVSGVYLRYKLRH